MNVRAADKNRPVPREGMKPRYDKKGRPLHLIGLEPVEVPNTPYYRKRLRKGDLVRAEAQATPRDA